LKKRQLGIKIDDFESDNQILKIVQEELIDLQGSKEFKSIIQTMTKIFRKTENYIILNYEWFVDSAQEIFGGIIGSKTLESIKLKLSKLWTA